MLLLNNNLLQTVPVEGFLGLPFLNPLTETRDAGAPHGNQVRAVRGEDLSWSGEPTSFCSCPATRIVIGRHGEKLGSEWGSSFLRPMNPEWGLGPHLGLQHGSLREILM